MPESTINRPIPSLTQRLEELSFEDLDAILVWIADATTEGTPKSTDVIRAFVTHGFDINVNAGIDLKVGDRDNYARYIVGQALFDLVKFGHIGREILSPLRAWQEQFS
jgi:hypothetical protein